MEKGRSGVEVHWRMHSKVLHTFDLLERTKKNEETFDSSSDLANLISELLQTSNVLRLAAHRNVFPENSAERRTFYEDGLKNLCQISNLVIMDLPDLSMPAPQFRFCLRRADSIVIVQRNSYCIMLTQFC